MPLTMIFFMQFFFRHWDFHLLLMMTFDSVFAGFQFDTEDGDKILPGFLESIVGIQRGETRKFPYVFPESWAQEELRGVRANFTVSYISLLITCAFMHSLANVLQCLYILL